MYEDLETDAEFQNLVKSIAMPKLDLIIALAKTRGITEPARFWELFECVQHAWSQYKNTESGWWN